MSSEIYVRLSEYERDITQLIRRLLQAYVSCYVKISGGRIQEISGLSYFPDDMQSIGSAIPKERLWHYQELLADIKREYLKITEKASRSAAQRMVVPLEYLFQIFELNITERFCVMLSLAPELDYQFERIYVHLQDDYQKKLPSLDLCLRILAPEEEERYGILRMAAERKEVWNCFFPEFALGMKDAGSIGRILKLNPRFLDFLFEIDAEAEELKDHTRIYYPGEFAADPLGPQKKLPEEIGEILREGEKKKLLYLWGREGCGRKTQIRAFCRSAGMPLLAVRMNKAENQEEDLKRFLQALYTEMILRRSAVVFLDIDKCLEQNDVLKKMLPAIRRKLWKITDFIFMTGEKAWEWQEEWQEEEQFIQIPIQEFTPRQQKELWERELKGWELQKANLPELLSSKFSMTPGEIKKSAETAKQEARRKKYAVLAEKELHNACYQQFHHHLGDSAVRINASFSWEDLILPETQKIQLRQACNQILCRGKLYEEWGFGDKLSYGRGISMLFYGAPGTGKTMAAQVMAAELNMEIYRVDLSAVSSKYIGETEKNLKKIFDEVQRSRSILFFDEADALFGKRSEVKEAQDKYANAETAFLLQKMEEYDGIVILATNFLQNFDHAYRRRIKYVIYFPMPPEEERIRLWKNVFPQKAPVGKLDYAYLARQFELSGSDIKNAAVTAAFLAASDHTEIDMEKILLAIRQELQKYGRVIGQEEFGAYAYLMR